LIEVLVPQVACRLGQPDGIIAFDPSSLPKRGTQSVGVKRQWCGHRGKVDNCQVGVFMGYVCEDEHALLDFRLYLPEEWARDEQRRQECHVPPEIRYQTRQAQLSLFRLNHGLPRGQTHPEVVQGTTEFYHQITDSLLPQAQPVFDQQF
jgi:hypothetical protein